MKATGEVMAIAPSFEMALMKAVRGAEIGLDSLNRPTDDDTPILELLRRVDDHRLFTVFEALKSGVPVEKIHAITRIDRFFLYHLKRLADYELSLSTGLTPELYEQGKQYGYPDSTLLRLSGSSQLPVPPRAAVYRRRRIFTPPLTAFANPGASRVPENL